MLRMKCLFSSVIFAFFLSFNCLGQTQTSYTDIYPDTWVGTDALGRHMPTMEEVGPLKKDQRRVVGMFYITWHTLGLKNRENPQKSDVTRILEEHPEARLSGTDTAWGHFGSYHWGEPENGYFLSQDPYVIRKDMSMLSDAGVDVLIMDVTNAVRYWDEWEVVFSEMEKMREEGNKVPQFCFWAFNGPVITVVQDLYEKIYEKQKYKDLWFYWDDKSLLLYNDNPAVDANGIGPKNPNPHFDSAAVTDMDHPHYDDPYYTKKYYTDYTDEVKRFFTLRTMWWGYYEWAGERFVGTEDHWSFGYDLGNDSVKVMTPYQLASKHKGKIEQFAVTPAQHASTEIGKSWTKAKGEPSLNRYDLPDSAYIPWLGKKAAHPEGYGIYFQDRWEEALEADPQFLYLNDWSEWTAGKYGVGDNGKVSFMSRRSDFQFIDQYNAEFNRTIGPMKGGYTDNYYMQMVQNIRRYKGVRSVPVSTGFSKISIDGSFADWENIKPEFRDTKGDVVHRDFDGYGGTHYVDNSGRNDILKSKVAVDRKNIYFYVEAAEALTSHKGKNWMLLLIDADKNKKTGWHGYDFLINKNVEDNTTSLMKYDSQRKVWVETDRLNYRYQGKALEIEVPRKRLGLQSGHFSFDFHWSDNPESIQDIISLVTTGDNAPNRRFNYRFTWKK